MIGNMILYNSATASIIYLKTREYLYITLDGYPNMEKLNEFYNALLKGIKQSSAEKFLFDSSKISVIKSEDLFWVCSNLTPILSKHNGIKVALIMPENIFGVKSAETFYNLMKDSVNIGLFPSMEKAENWLFR